jgi:ABC-type Fe3+/spermidine/putrescine transport system ATPase subunit
MTGARLELDGLRVAYGGGAEVLRGLTLDVAPGEMVALVGESGCGKTTVLKVIAGLLGLDEGSVRVDGVAMDGVPAEKRRAAMVFQKPLLFPYLNVGENVGFALRLRGERDGEIRRRVEEALGLVRLEGYAGRRAEELSGGQEQRVSLARALVSEPRILLLDEPFAALDEGLRGEMRALVRGIQREVGVTTVFVTHDQREAAAMGHRVALLHGGRVEQAGPARDFYERPASVAAARFFGWQVVRGRAAGGRVECALGVFAAEVRDGAAWVAVRGEDVRLVDGDGARVAGSIDVGTAVETVVELGTGERVELRHGPPAWEAGRGVGVVVNEARVRVFAGD